MHIFDEAAVGELQSIASILGPLRSFDPKVAAALVDALRHIDRTPKTVLAADRAQEAVCEVFVAHRHHAAAFLKVYHGITVAVIEALEVGRLTPRSFFQRIPGRFAERHFDGLKAELGLDTTTDAARYALWKPSFAFDNLQPTADRPIARKPRCPA